MDTGKRETSCSRCLHSDVCIHKQDFIDINNAIFNATVSKAYKDSNSTACSLKRVSDFECFGGVTVNCRYFTEKCVRRNRRPEKLISEGV